VTATADADARRSAARAAAWREDLDVARDEFLRRDRSYSPAARADASHRLQRLRERTGRLDDVQIAAELARIAALAGNAHTRLYVLRNRGHWRRYPLRLWRFADGWRVVAAQGEASTLLGGRLTHVAGRPVDTVFASLRPLFAGNDSWAQYMGSYTLTSPDPRRWPRRRRRACPVPRRAGGRRPFVRPVAEPVRAARERGGELVVSLARARRRPGVAARPRRGATA